jgi:hypothetical protein
MSGALDSDRVLVAALAKGEDEGALLDASFNEADGNECSFDKVAASLPRRSTTRQPCRPRCNEVVTIRVTPCLMSRAARTRAIVSPPGSGAAVKTI